jgi:hypothetical protein
MQIGKQLKKRNQMIVKSILVYAIAMIGKGRILVKAMKREEDEEPENEDTTDV